MVTDSEFRRTKDHEISDYFVNVKDIIAKNRREKADVIFGNYQISLKTLMQENSEINMGSFEKRVLFDGLNVDSYLVERRGSNNAGLGSKALLLNLFSVMITLGKDDVWAKFSHKFIKMVAEIYTDDTIIAIKNDKFMSLYFFSSDEILEIFRSFCGSPKELLKILNRWEGNSIRVDRSPFLNACKRVVCLDFSHLSLGIMAEIKKFDYELHSSYAKFFNENNMQGEILEKLSKLFDKFRANLGELK